MCASLYRHMHSTVDNPDYHGIFPGEDYRPTEVCGDPEGGEGTVTTAGRELQISVLIDPVCHILQRPQGKLFVPLYSRTCPERPPH